MLTTAIAALWQAGILQMLLTGLIGWLAPSPADRAKISQEKHAAFVNNAHAQIALVKAAQTEEDRANAIKSLSDLLSAGP